MHTQLSNKGRSIFIITVVHWNSHQTVRHLHASFGHSIQTPSPHSITSPSPLLHIQLVSCHVFFCCCLWYWGSGWASLPPSLSFSHPAPITNAAPMTQPAFFHLTPHTHKQTNSYTNNSLDTCKAHAHSHPSLPHTRIHANAIKTHTQPLTSQSLQIPIIRAADMSKTISAVDYLHAHSHNKLT